MRTSAVFALLTALGGAALWNALPTLIGRLVASDRQHPGIARLRVAHAMAGGGDAASTEIADAMKAMVTSKLIGAWNEAAVRGVPADSRAAWHSLMATLQSAEARYLSPAMSFGLGPPSHASSEIAEGLRYVSHVTRIALELYTEASPAFVRFVTPTIKLLGDNPDALYYISLVHPARSYTISGCRGEGEAYMSISVHAQPEGSAFPRVIADLNDDRLAFDANDCYRIVLAPRSPSVLPSGTTFLAMPAGAESVVTRHYFENTAPRVQLDRKLEAAVFASLSIVDNEEQHQQQASPLTDAQMAARLAGANAFIRSMTVGNEVPDPTTAPPFFSLSPNKVGPPQKWSRDSEGMGAVDIAYAGGRFLLRDGEALLIRGSLPPCRFANIVLWNRFLQSFDYAKAAAPVSLNRKHLNVDGSGRFTIVLAARNPFTDAAHAQRLRANWLCSEGRTTATMFFRFVLPEVDAVEQPRTQVVPLSGVLAALA
jgi:hypothetical protein